MHSEQGVAGGRISIAAIAAWSASIACFFFAGVKMAEFMPQYPATSLR